MKPGLLYLVHRIPYPPNKGDKITSYNLLKYLSRFYSIHLGCFVDADEDWQYVEKVEEYCVETCFAGLNPRRAKIESLRGIFTGEPLTLPYYRNARLSKWVDWVIREREIAAVLIFSGAMAQYVSGKLPPGIRSLLDLEDVDSDKWRLYAEKHRWPVNWIYRRESESLLRFEKAAATEFDATLFVSQEEAALFRRLAPEVAHKVAYRTQGVDSRFFDPAIGHDNPYQPGEKSLVFVGAMDYWPNIDAALWFGREIFPEIKAAVPEFSFYVVGMNPGDEVRRLEETPGITVTGGVPDVRPYVAHAVATVMPLRIARGIQNKVLEAMAMEKEVLATTNALHGIETGASFKPRVADDVESMVAGAIELLHGERRRVPAGRECVLERYDWENNLRKIRMLLESGPQNNENKDDRS